MHNWNAHFDDNCQVCDTVNLLSKGVIVLRKINKTHPKYHVGQPTSKRFWDQSVPNTLTQSIPLDSIHPNMRTADLDEHTNTHILLYRCGLCADVLRRPSIYPFPIFQNIQKPNWNQKVSVLHAI